MRIRCLLGSRKCCASAASQKAIPARSSAPGWQVVGDLLTSAEACGVRAHLPAARANRPCGRQDQHDDHDGVDDEGAELRDVVLAGDVADADQERGEERSGDARGAADRHHDQEIDHEFQREGRVEAEDLRAERAAEAGEAGAEREGEREHAVDVDAEPARHARVIDRRRAAGCRSGCPTRMSCRPSVSSAADHDDQQAIAANADAEQLELALQHARDLDEDLLRAHDVVDGGDRHEHEADGEQHLVEMGLAVDMDIEGALEQRADAAR